MKNNKQTLVIADDHVVFAEGLASLLRSKHMDMGIDVVGTATELRLYFSKKTASIAFVDIEFGNTDGRDVAAMLKKEYPECFFVALSSHAEPQIIKSALQGAFAGYVLKTDSLDTIVTCINKVLEGGRFVSPDAGAVLIDDVSGNTRQQLIPRLTKREKEVLTCIAREMNTNEIAEHLFVSRKTIEVHRSNLLLKLDVKNVAGLIRRAFELGLLN